jgi:chromosomal replication initiator protein
LRETGDRADGPALWSPTVPRDAVPTDLDSLWGDVREQLSASVPESTFRLWLEPLSPVGARERTLLLTAPARISAWVERRYAGLLVAALANCDAPFDSVALVDSGAGPAGPSDAGCEAELSLNPSYTFERFVIGRGNRLAHAGALAVAEAPSEAYNPLFLHGPPGLGKTHLLVAIANYLRAHAPGLGVRYTTAECFTNEFVGSLRSSGLEAFKRRYRDLDILLVDDVQFLEGKHHTEEEFFHTFNALYEGGSQLVLSADRIPSELSTLAARLRDRFEWGLTIPLEEPDHPTRLTVLQRLAREAGLDAADAGALAELARRSDANLRRLRGALTRVIAHASLTSKPISTELIAELIPQVGRPARPTAVEEIQERVASSFGISKAELVGSSRAGTPLRARQVAILLTRELTDLSLPQIGRLYGNRDHSTIHNSIRRAEDSLAADAELAERVRQLRADIHSQGGAGA